MQTAVELAEDEGMWISCCIQALDARMTHPNAYFIVMQNMRFRQIPALCKNTSTGQ